MAGDELAFINELLSSFSLAHLTVSEQRSAMERSASSPLAGTTVVHIDSVGVPAEWIIAPEVTGDAVLLSLHGGAYSLGSLITNRWFSSLLSQATNRRVLSIAADRAGQLRRPLAAKPG
jgi:acetyl esterase/lipase